MTHSLDNRQEGEAMTSAPIENAELKGCPFCGGTNPRRVWSPDDYMTYVECSDCYAKTGKAGNSELAWMEWNTRAKPAPDAWRDESENGWVIESIYSSPSAPEYWNGGRDSQSWTLDHLRAVRFSRKQDADMVADTVFSGKGHRVCEHYWTGLYLTDHLHTPTPEGEMK